MAAPLKMSTAERNGVIELTLSGVISEKTPMDAVSLTKGNPVVIDTGGILSINSFGVRTWVNFLSSLCDECPKVTIRRVPPVLVTQAGMIANFLGNAYVESFFTPWCCIDCGHETLKLHQANDDIPEAYQCPECDSEMEFDDIRESYLAFRGV